MAVRQGDLGGRLNLEIFDLAVLQKRLPNIFIHLQIGKDGLMEYNTIQYEATGRYRYFNL